MYAFDLSRVLLYTAVTGVPYGWSKVPATIALAGASAVGTIVSTEYQLLGAPSWTPYAGPFQSGAEGETTYACRSTDSRGNVEDPGTFVVRIDSRPPKTKARAAASCKKGRTATLKYKVLDPLPGSEAATVTIDIVNRRHKVVMTLPLGEIPSNQAMTTRVTCTLAKGAYTYKVYAVDLAGNAQTKAGSAKLTVR